MRSRASSSPNGTQPRRIAKISRLARLGPWFLPIAVMFICRLGWTAPRSVGTHGGGNLPSPRRQVIGFPHSHTVGGVAWKRNAAGSRWCSRTHMVGLAFVAEPL